MDKERNTLSMLVAVRHCKFKENIMTCQVNHKHKYCD